jgi:archaetidylinositol phosphate synthase
MYLPLGQRLHTSFLAKWEARVLAWLCAHCPSRIVPDHMTALGLAGAFVAFCGYVATRYNPAFLWLASFGLVLHWFGDSLDGSLARYRGKERPRYGYFLDCMTDVFCCLIIMAGLGLSPFVRMDAALFTAVGYYMICIYVFLHHHVTGVHKLSFSGLGPTEMRLALIAMNVWMFVQGAVQFRIAGQGFSIYDLALIGNGLVSVAVFVRLLIMKSAELRPEAAGDGPQAQEKRGLVGSLLDG